MEKIKVYSGGGFQEYSALELVEFIKCERLTVVPSKIVSLKILKRKFLSNEGNALDGILSLSNNNVTGINIGGNPIGTGYKNYLQFLEEMGCKKICGLYFLNSLIGFPITTLFSRDIRNGILSSRGTYELYNYLK